MNKKVVLLAKQLLGTIPKQDIDQLVKLLEYYNRAPDNQRVKAMEVGFSAPKDQTLEESVMNELGMSKTASAGLSYIKSDSSVCKCCGK